MLNWLKKKSKSSETSSKKGEAIQKVAMKPLNYSPKIILAWAKAIDGNTEIGAWLKANNYEELVYATSAIYLNNKARTWLMKNGFPQLMAMIHASEGDEKAQKWLLFNNFELLYHIALAVEDDQESWKWLNLNSTQDIFMLAKTIKKVKDKIEENHNDVHSFGKD